MRAIDIHVHVPAPARPSGGCRKRKHGRRTSRPGTLPRTPEEMYEKYKALDFFGVIFAIDAETTSGIPYVGNDYVASVAQQYPDRFIGFRLGGPLEGDMAIQELERSVKELGLRGLKLHPTTQAFFPNDIRFYPLWEKCAELGIPASLPYGADRRGRRNARRRRLQAQVCPPICISTMSPPTSPT